MKSVIDNIKAFRGANLLIIVVTIYIVLEAVIYEALDRYGIAHALSERQIIWLVGCLLGLVGAAYVFNDLQDQAVDRLNEKPRFFVSDGRTITGYIQFAILTGLSFIMSWRLATEVGHPSYIYFYIVTFLLLIAYNLYLKKWPWVGNILVAALCAAVLWVPVLAERDGLARLAVLDLALYQAQIQLLIFYTAFAFLTNLIREIIKDGEDQKGDQAHGYRTLPLLYSEVGVKRILFFLQMLLGGGLVAYIIYTSLWNDRIKLFAALGLLILPWLFLLLRLVQRDKLNYTTMSMMYKVWMFLGLIYFVIAAYL